MSLLSQIMEHQAGGKDRGALCALHLPDYPEHCIRAGILAQHGANIVKNFSHYNHAYYSINLGDTAIDITIKNAQPTTLLNSSQRS